MNLNYNAGDFSIVMIQRNLSKISQHLCGGKEFCDPQSTFSALFSYQFPANFKTFLTSYLIMSIKKLIYNI